MNNSNIQSINNDLNHSINSISKSIEIIIDNGEKLKPLMEKSNKLSKGTKFLLNTTRLKNKRKNRCLCTKIIFHSKYTFIFFLLISSLLFYIFLYKPIVNMYYSNIE